MKTKIIFLCLLELNLLSVGCTKQLCSQAFNDEIVCNVEISQEQGGMMSFDSPEALQNYMDNFETSLLTKSSNANFISLWQSLIDSKMQTLDPQVIVDAQKEGLVYEPEDEIISDPDFAKILNAKREIMIGRQIYRFINNGILVYEPNVSEEMLESISVSDLSNLEHGDTIVLRDGIAFIRINYVQPIIYDDFGLLQTKAPTLPDTSVNNNALSLKGNIEISGDKLQRISYAKGSGDANGFQKAISSLFGTSVVASNYFDDKHRMKLRTFAQDFVVYRSVGMTVRMQQKKAAIWWRKKAEEFRYGWTAVECSYTYNGPVFPANIDLNNVNALTKQTSYYEKPMVIMSVPIVDLKITDKDILNVLKTALSKNKSKIDKWMNDNPDYKSSPQSIYTSEKRESLRIVYPQHEETAINDGREKVNWDFMVMSGTFGASLNVNLGGTTSYKITPFVTPSVTNVTIDRGEMYGAVKYDGEWRACVISTK
ncbi:MAG: hypothetical protein NC080_04800 [Paraprevotella sp.]|nr:hypothetical protein [Paraprevotella sp.]